MKEIGTSSKPGVLFSALLGLAMFLPFFGIFLPGSYSILPSMVAFVLIPVAFACMKKPTASSSAKDGSEIQ